MYPCIFLFVPPYVALRFFPECVARVPVSLWGSGGKALLANSCVCVTVGNRPPYGFPQWRMNAHGAVSKVSQVDLRDYIGVCRAGVCVNDL